MPRYSNAQPAFFSDHTRLLALALPMILANITTPLLGLVDTAVLGHMSMPAMLAGASIGALILTQIYWVCGFLRMSSTGLSAQAKGSNEAHYESAKVLWQTIAVALVLGISILAFQKPIVQVGLNLTNPNVNVATHLSDYFYARVWGAPAAMLNLALVGWLVGQQKTRSVMTIQIVGNLLNAGLDVLFVFGLGLSVAGVAYASVIAEYSMAVMSLTVALKCVGDVSISAAWFNRAARKVLLKLNGDMLIRNLALQACLAFLTIQGARYGEVPAAVNAILMQFFVLIALGLDGIAYGVEALVGEAKGARNAHEINRRTYQGLLWSSLFAVLYSVVFLFAGERIVALLTQHVAIIDAALPYLPLMVLLPLLGHWCFLYDGVFVGLTRAESMRNTMVISALFVFFPIWYITQHQGNVSLWYALLAFLFARGVTLGWTFYRMDKLA
ncbi:MATE family efflux transporter [Alteromonas sp. McT4-15]|uniref:MATE family efflux transporter n=1 Tax=Alteromonas sp. McT4-15 TaxID=2881256 RepID=UPI001CF84F6C|nr:MATE family efflux transporter [Alteromonas sp. McT4-15]MCB4434642.1 MATE family efflux transporter [Alteromonas sp. McT4-15]